MATAFLSGLLLGLVAARMWTLRANYRKARNEGAGRIEAIAATLVQGGGGGGPQERP
jgi:hypothetical protein